MVREKGKRQQQNVAEKLHRRAKSDLRQKFSDVEETLFDDNEWVMKKIPPILREQYPGKWVAVAVPELTVLAASVNHATMRRKLRKARNGHKFVYIFKS